jgi:tRNA dimethylallyltransferase
VELARHVEGEIVNADSMQVYRWMDVGTAKPTVPERKGIPHHLLDVVAPDEDFDAARYRSLAAAAAEGILARGKRCFVVGGSGLYIRALLGGLLSCPPADPALRRELREACEQSGPEALHTRLRKLDPDYAGRIHPRDRVRIIRALEVVQLTGAPFSSLIREHRFQDRAFDALKICLQMPREDLYHRINQRALTMVRNGLVEETAGLLRRGYSRDLKPLKSIGYRHAVKILDGSWGLEKALRQLQTDTRRYAKRQVTWFRSDPDMQGREPGDRDGILTEVERFLA